MSQAHLEGTENLFQSIADSSPDAIVAADLDGRIIYFSSGAQDLFGCRAEEVLGRPLADFYRGGLEEARALMRRVEGEGGVRNYRTVVRAGDDGRWVEASISVSRLRDAGGTTVGTLAVLKDETEQRRLTEELIRSERVQALAGMAGGVAHRFNNLLTIILGQSELLERSVSQPDGTKRLHLIQRAVSDAVETTRRLQQFAGVLGEHPFVSVDVGAVVREALTLARGVCPKDATPWQGELKVEVDVRQVPPLAGERAELREMLFNLILNALEAMPQGGTLTLRMREVPHPDGLDGRGVEVQVSDTGIGMSEAIRARLFEPLFTTKDGRGRGLGLAVAHGIVRRHGGEIHVESREGEGSDWTVRLPVQAGEREGRPGPVPRAAGGAPLRVLLIEDQEPVREVLSEVLSAGGHSVEAAGNAVSALESFQPGVFDLVVTDLGMSGMSGWDVARAIKGRDASVRVLLLTGWADQGTTERIRSSGVDRVLTKPVSVEQLMSEVSALCLKPAPLV
ncbi:MAG: ATP-binding protein [Candidatus Methylomirabilia bacterium]